MPDIKGGPKDTEMNQDLKDAVGAIDRGAERDKVKRVFLDKWGTDKAKTFEDYVGAGAEF